MKMKKKLPKAANGLKQVIANQNNMRSTASTIAQTGAEALFPGVGGAALGGLEAISSSLKDENGLYKSKAGQALDVLNPVTAATRIGTGIGQLFSGDKLDLDGQDALKKKLKEQQLAITQQGNWDQVTKQDNLQAGQYKMGAKAIEIEGKEPLFSKKVNGKRTLKVYEPNGPTHEEGGIPVLAKEGDAVITAKGNLGAQAVAAHGRGDHQMVEKLINKMPADKGVKKADGTRGVKKRNSPVTTLQRSMNAAGYNVEEDGMLGPQTNAAFADMRGDNKPMSFINSLTKSTLPTKLSTLPPTAPAIKGITNKQKAATATGNKALSALTAVPTLYNLSQGLFGDTQKTTRRNYNPALQNYEDMSDPLRRQSNVVSKMQVDNSRNLSGGSASNVRSNANQAYADNFSRQANIENAELGRRLQVDGQNKESLNRASLINNQMNDRADDLDLQNAAKKQEALSKGLEGISGLASNQLLTNNTIAKENADRAMLSEAYRSYTLDENGKPILKGKLPKGKKGMKSIKVKK